MVKAKTDPSAPAAVVQLLDQIEAASPQRGELQPSSSSSASQPTASRLASELVDLLQRCLDLIYESEQSDELSPSLKYGLDGLRTWANHCSRLVTLVPLAGAGIDARRQLLGSEHQRKLANVIWSACQSERTQIATRSKAAIEGLVELLHRIELSNEALQVIGQQQQDSTAEGRGKAEVPPSVMPFPSNSSFISDLVARCFTQLERKQAPVILEVLLAKYGSAPFQQGGPAGASYTDSQVYHRIVRGLGTVDGGANRRSRLALGFLQARANDLGCRLSRKAAPAPDEQRPSDDTAWRQWSAIWLGPLKTALEDGGERLRSGLASYHLAPLFEMDSRVFGLLLDSIMRPSQQAAKESGDINVEAVFMTLRMGKTQGFCRISDKADFDSEIGPDGVTRVLVPSPLLKDCILSAASELQISTLSLVIESRTPALAFNTAELDILRTFFPYSLTISNPGARGELRGFFVKMLTRLRASSYALARDAAKITRIAEDERLPEERTQLAALQGDLTAVQSFLEWIYALIRQTLHPGASYQACITALTFLDLILESGIDPRFSQPGAAASTKATDKTLTKNAGMTLAKNKQVFVQDFPFTLNIISPALVQLLLSCSESTYDDIQNRAMTMLIRFPAPLPGLSDKEAAISRILGRAAKLMISSRDFESAAASRLIQLYKSIYIDRLDWQPSSLLALAGFGDVAAAQGSTDEAATANKQIQLICHHLDLLSHLLSIAESGKVLEAATSYPVHGTLVTLQELFASVQLSKLSGSDTQALAQAIRAAEAMVDRTWDVTKPVLCNSAPEGSVGSASTAEEHANDGSQGLHQPTHESARAMRIADADGKAEGMEQQEESIAGPKHQVILSYSWRGMKEASALLGVLVSSTLKASTKRSASDVGGTAGASSLWSVQSIQGVGARFNLWLTQVRHRGAFSTIYPAYCNAAAAIVRSGWKDVETLPQQWIDTFLEAVAEPGTKLSITRRSAGIGYAVLALVSAHPNKTDTTVLLAAVRRLIDIARGARDDENATLPVSAIHALNILRVLVSDGQLSEYMSPFVGELLELTISKFSSRFWGLRNVSMMLSSSLCIRCFSSRHTNKDTKDARMPVDEFFATYPNMDSFLQHTLSAKAAEASAGQGEQAESSVFAVLMLFSRMQAPEVRPASARHSERQAAFAALIARCASNPVWKIREIAAKAYAAVVPLSEAAQRCVDLLEESSVTRQNQLHGHLLMIQRLLRSPKESEAPSASLEAGMTALANALCQGVTRFLVNNACAATQVAYLEVLQDFASVRPLDFSSLGDSVLSAARPWMDQLLGSAAQQADTLLRTPLGPSMLSACTRAVLQADCRRTSSTGEFLRTCIGLFSHHVEEVRLAVLEAVAGDDGTALRNAAASSATGRAQLADFAREIHCVISEATAGIWIRVNAAEVLRLLLAPLDDRRHGIELASALFPDATALTSAVVELTDVARSTPIVPLREALLPYIAGLCASLCSSVSSDTGARQAAVERWCNTVARCADEYESVQSREAAGEALRIMGPFLFPAPAAVDLLGTESADLFAARLASINLLTDDDEDVRIEAAAMIGETIAVGSVSSSALEKSSAVSSRDTRRSYHLEALTRVARSGGTSSEVSTDRAWSWMAHHYSGSATSRLWTHYIWSQLVSPPSASDREFAEAFSPSAMLFAEEKPNQFRDAEATIRRAHASILSGELAPASREFAIDLADRTISDIDRLFSALRLSDKETPRRGDATVEADLVATHLLASRVVLAVSALKHSNTFPREKSAAIEEAAAKAARVAQALELDAGHDLVGDGPSGTASPRGAQDDRPSYSIAMVSDFFFPNVGGVEGHIYLVSRALLDLGHKASAGLVIIITHAYAPNRVGVRYLSPGLKVYYVPYGVIARQDTLPNFFALFPMLRSILIREQVQIVHGHQALSSMAHEGILHARTLGLKTVFTDHSLFGFADAASILTNKLLRFALSDVDAVVAVSHTGKENTTLRAHLDPSKVSVIPNAVVAEHFQPDPSRADPSRLTVVVLSRLMYRKGIDLLIAAIPRLCANHKDLYFLIGGDGPKRVELEQMRERYMIQDRVELVGAVRQSDVRSHLTRGQIFLNTSLTEAFGTGIIEAACAGLFVVSTRVGGVPEVLPDTMVRLALPEEDDVVRAMEDAIVHLRAGRHDPVAYHNALRRMYSWGNVAARLERVYDQVAALPFPSRTERFRRYYAGGAIAGKIFCIIVAVDMIFLRILEWFLPSANIDTPPSLHHHHHRRNRDRDRRGLPRAPRVEEPTSAPP